MINLAESYRRAGHTQDALKLNEEALQLHQAKLGRDHANTLRCMNNVALCYFAIGRNKDALNLFEATFQLQKANLGPDHTDTLMTMNSLAWSYRRAGRKQDALKLNEEALQLHKAKLGRDHPNTLMSMDNLASSYEDVDRTQDALKLREETVLLSKTKLGPDHPDTLMSMNNLAGSYAAAGRHQDALKLFEETFQLYRAKLGTEHPDTLMSMNNLADSYTTAQPSKALELLERIVSLRERRAGAEPSNSVEQSFLAWTHGQRGEAAQALQDYPAAVNFYARSVEIFSKVDKAGKLTEPFFRDKLNFSQQRLTLCQKAQGAVQDLDFTLKQPAAEIPALLDIRVRFFLKEQKLPTAMESAAKMKQLANEKPDQLYDAACLYALCAGAKTPRADATRLTKECAEEAMTLLKQAIVKGYKNAPHMKQDPDLAALRGRADFDKLLAELEGKK
jgi:tetratricopeptide (TPR) repeat protein